MGEKVNLVLKPLKKANPKLMNDLTMRRHPLRSLLCAFAVGILIIPGYSPAQLKLPPSVAVDKGKVKPVCNVVGRKAWRESQVIEGVQIQESVLCDPDNPYTVAAAVKGTNNVSMTTLMETNFAADSVIKKNDRDGDGDPDDIIIKLEVMEINGHSPDFVGVVPTFDVAPGIQPGMWVFAPKTRGMSTESFVSLAANPMIRAPSPAIRVEQGDRVWIVLENTHYFPHTIHLHGVDHPFTDITGEGNDGVPQTSDKYVLPGTRRVYEIRPRQTGTMVYHCHVQTHTHLAMGLVGMFVVEENQPDNWVQSVNIGAGHVRHPSVGVLAQYDQEYDLHYHALDKELHNIIQNYNDPRLIAKKMNREYDITDSTEDYFTLNGRSFPYTIRESLVVVEPNQNIKIRMLNSGSEMAAIHTHGHKATITHYDGIEHNPVAQITRDVYDIAPAQRYDLKISTIDDGTHSYGQGIWIFHDHMERGITNDGVNPGGDVSAIVYKSYLSENGIPKTKGIDISAYFGRKFQTRGVPVFANLDAWNSLGGVFGLEPEPAPKQAVPKPVVTPPLVTPNSGNAFRNFIVGLLLGLAVYLLYIQREHVARLTNQAVALLKTSTGGVK